VAVSVYSDRIKRRYELFWRTRRFGLHGKGRCLLTYLNRSDPIEKWHCCDLWQRKLANKWNAREFAVMHGCRVPELYWHGRRPERIPFDELPDRYVIRPTVGHSKRGIFLMADGVNLLDGRAYSPEELITRIRRGLHALSRRQVLVEEFLRPADRESQRPVECKGFMFGTRIAAIASGEPAFAVHFMD
jgi:hypothetical protein